MRYLFFTLAFCLYWVGVSPSITYAGNVLSTLVTAKGEHSQEDPQVEQDVTPPTEVEIPYIEEKGLLPLKVQQKFKEYPITCSSGDGVFRKKGFSTCQDNDRLYIYLCYVLTNLGYTMEITNCKVIGDTLRVYATPIENGKTKGRALHNSIKIFSIAENEELTKLQLMTYDGIGVNKVVQ